MSENLYPDDSATSVSRVRFGKSRTNGYVVLDSAWARLLGVRRSGGVYRIARWRLRERLAQLQPGSLEEVLRLPVAPGGAGLTANEPVHHGSDGHKTHSHIVELYETEEFLADSVHDFLAPGLLAGDAAIVVATSTHRESIDRVLGLAGIDVAEAKRCGRYNAVDALQTLETFVVDGMPDPARFGKAIGQLISRAAENDRDVRIYGEMVAVLWNEGNVVATIALEDLWNDLATRYQFSLLCAYPIRVFDTDVNAEPFRRICGQHSKVIGEGQGL